MKLVGKILLILGALIVIGFIVYINIIQPNPRGILLFGFIIALIGFIIYVKDDI